MRKWSKAPRILSLLAVMIAAAVGFAPAAHAAEGLSLIHIYRAWARYSLPEAVLEVKQAAGRLIRTSTDLSLIHI